MRTIVGVCVLALAATGCYKATFIRDPDAVRGVQQDRWTDFFIFGLVGEQNFDVHDFCPNGRVAEVQTGANFGTGIVSLLTIGIYTPRKVWVTCAGDSGRASLEIAADTHGRPVAAVRRSGGVALAARIEPTGLGTWKVSFGEELP